MKSLLCLLLVIPLSGCLYQKVTQIEIIAGEQVCKEANGVRYIRSWGTGALDVRCNTGEYVDYGKVVEIINTLEPSYNNKGD